MDEKGFSCRIRNTVCLPAARSTKAKAADSLKESTAYRILVAGTGFEPVTFGL
jgi:hypothetical protein